MSQAKATSDTTTDAEPVTYETLSELERGDVLIVNGQRYPVYRMNTGLRSLFTPDHPEVLADGEIRRLAYGALSADQTGDPEDNPTGLAFASVIPDDYDDTEPFPKELLLAENLENVYVERQAADAYDLHRSHDSRTCPDCGNDTSRYQYGRNQDGYVQEVHKCNGEDCSAVWCYGREIDTDTTGTVTTYHPKTDEYDTVELSGVYRAVHTSRFKMDPTDHDRQEWYTAEEVAQFLKPKMNHDGDSERFGVVRPRSRNGVTWKDAQYDWKTKIEFRSARGF